MKKVTTSQRLKEIMKERGLKQVDILELAKPFCDKYNVKLNKNDLSQYVSGKVEPGQYKLSILGYALNVSEAWLMGYDVPKIPSLNFNENIDSNEPITIQSALKGLENTKKIFSESISELDELQYIKKYRTLDEYGKKAVNSILNIEYERCISAKREQEEMPRDNIILTMYEDVVSAGTGEFLNDGRCIDVAVERTAETERADCIIRVSGDSMEPTYYDGDKVLVEYTKELNVGDIGIFILNNHGYIKEYGRQGLVSHNQKYDVIIVHEYDNCECFGKVIGRV